MPLNKPGTVQVDAYFDLICPWCWIGKAHLSTARRLLAERMPEIQMCIRWHLVQLIPQVPPQGWPYQAFYEHRLGGPEAVRARRAQVQTAASQAGLTIHHERIAMFPNTWRAHRLLALAGKLRASASEALLDALFESYFVQGLNLGDDQVLASLAQAQCIDISQTEDLTAPAIWHLPEGASGVPMFVFNQQQAISGAQPPEVLLSAMLDSLRSNV
jgi:predicted DsbA family dithiol-disulfide isomerase